MISISDHRMDSDRQDSSAWSRECSGQGGGRTLSEQQVWDKYRGPAPILPSRIRGDFYEGMLTLTYSEPAEIHIPKVKDMEMFPDDVLLCTYPRSGTHWTFRVVDMLIRGSTQYSDRQMSCGLLDTQKVEDLHRAGRPRILSTHYPFHLLPRQLGSTKGLKMVHVFRNPKAVAASLIHMDVSQQVVGRPLSDGETVDLFLNQQSLHRNSFYYWDTVIEFEKKHPDINIFHIAYEELKMDPVGSIGRLARFLGRAGDDQLYMRVAQATSFSVHSKAEMEHSNIPTMGWSVGEIDSWKHHLTVAQSEQMDQALRERSDRCPFSRCYVSDQGSPSSSSSSSSFSSSRRQQHASL